MIRIHPTLSYEPPCPACGGTLEGLTVRITGMRNLVEGSCAACKRSLYIDLPVGHALASPIAVDVASGEVFDPTDCGWFSEPLLRASREREGLAVPIRVTRCRPAREIVLVNCLDNLYGHSLLKLLNVEQHIDRFPQLGCCVLIPRQLAHLVPDGVAEIWEVNLPMKEMVGWYTAIEDFVRDQIDARDACYLSFAFSHPHPSRYTITRFTGVMAPSAEPGTTRVVFSYREDRLWGSSSRNQHRRITRLFRLLKQHFRQLDFVVIGFGNGARFPAGVRDLRAASSTPEVERAWLEALAGADCAIGVHGSNMLLPTALAKHVVELLPEDRLGNEIQTLLFGAPDSDAREALYRFRILYGRMDLTDVSPDLVASVSANQIKRWPGFHASMCLEQQVYDERQLWVDPQPLVDRMQSIAKSTNAALQRRPRKLDLYLQWTRARRLLRRLAGSDAR